MRGAGNTKAPEGCPPGAFSLTRALGALSQTGIRGDDAGPRRGRVRVTRLHRVGDRALEAEVVERAAAAEPDAHGDHGGRLADGAARAGRRSPGEALRAVRSGRRVVEARAGTPAEVGVLVDERAGADVGGGAQDEVELGDDEV